eukprot:3283900-Amphidinium_carterae.1
MSGQLLMQTARLCSSISSHCGARGTSNLDGDAFLREPWSAHLRQEERRAEDMGSCAVKSAPALVQRHQGQAKHPLAV